jgi:hypothetical protein
LSRYQRKGQRVSLWHPIETAPKDGAPVLVSRKFGGIVVARVKHGWNTWTTIPGDYGIEPTHWMPLPLPPIRDSG